MAFKHSNSQVCDFWAFSTALFWGWISLHGLSVTHLLLSYCACCFLKRIVCFYSFTLKTFSFMSSFTIAYMFSFLSFKPKKPFFLTMRKTKCSALCNYSIHNNFSTSPSIWTTSLFIPCVLFRIQWKPIKDCRKLQLHSHLINNSCFFVVTTHSGY